MSLREGPFCDLPSSGAVCPRPACGTCQVCQRDFCEQHSWAEAALRVSLLSTRRNGSPDTIFNLDLEICNACLGALVRDGGLQYDVQMAMGDAALTTLAAARTAKALAPTSE
jgi:hypothetical protein